MSSWMPTGTVPNWKNPADRQAVLDTHYPNSLQNPIYQVSEPGLPPCSLRWRNADKAAYNILLQHSGNPQGVAWAFKHYYEPPADIQKRIQAGIEHARCILETFPKLQIILQNFESLIRSRWEMMSEAERWGVMIPSGKPDGIPTVHRPDLLALQKRPRTPAANSQPKDRDFLIPHLNLKDLANGKTFLRLLNSRGRNEPAEFAFFDLETAQVGLRTKELRSTFIATGIDMSSDVSTRRYGLVDPSSQASMDAAVSQRKMAASDGLIVLHIQHLILGFLKRCCEAILNDKSETIYDLGLVQPMPAPLPPHDEPTNGALALALQRPYRHPRATFDFQNLLNQARAALDEAVDHIWALREDPSYFDTVVTEYQQHQFEHIRDKSGHRHPDVKLPDSGFLGKCLGNMLRQIYMAVLNWEIIISLLEEVANEETRFLQTGIEFEEDDLVFYGSLLCLRLAFDDLMFISTMERVVQNLVANPLTRKQWKRARPASTTPSPKQTLDQVTDPLLFLTRHGYAHLWSRSSDEHAQHAPVMGMDDILLEIQRHIATGQEKSDLLSPLAVKTIAEAGLQAEMRSQLSSYRPRVFSPYLGIGFEDVGARESVYREAAQQSIHAVHPMRGTLSELLHDNPGFPNLGPYADPSGGLFTCPVNEERNQANTAAMRTAEANLDIFWRKFDDFVEENHKGLSLKVRSLFSGRELARTPDRVEPAVQSSKSGGQAAASSSDQVSASFGSLSIDPSNSGRRSSEASELELARTTDWVEPAVQSSQSRGQAAASSPDLSAPFGGLSIDPSNSQGRSSLARDAPKKKVKTKTRGTADPSKAVEPVAQQDAENVAEAAEPAPRPIFQVSGRAMRVIATLFHQPSVQERQGEVHWRDFLHTMAAVGFTCETMYGSAVNFTPTGPELMALSRHSIMIHSPHPSQKMAWVIARSIGRRLTRNYGLDASFFEEE